MNDGGAGERQQWVVGGAQGPPPPVPGGEPPVPGGESRRVLQAVAVTVFLAVGVAFSGWVAFGGDGDSGYRAGPLPGVNESPAPGPSGGGTPSADVHPSPGPETGAPTEVPTGLPTGVPAPSPSATPFGTSSPSLTGGEAPAGYRTQADPVGFHLAVPDGWRRTVEGPSVFYTSPDDTTKIQIFELHGPEATPYESAREAERIASTHRGYEQVTLAPLGTGAMDPAELEYTYDSPGSGHRRILDRRFAVPDGTMYAVLVIGPSGDRAREREIHQTALDTFCPTASCTTS